MLYKVEERSSKLVVTRYLGRIQVFRWIRYVTARRLADFLPLLDVNGLVFCAVTAVLLFFKPWQYLLTGPRHGLLLLLGLGAATSWLLAHDGLDTKVQRFCRVLCVYAVFLNLARYPVAVIGDTANGLVAGPTYLVVVQAVGVISGIFAWRYPGWLGLSMAAAIYARRVHARIMGFEQPMVDEEHLAEVVLFFLFLVVASRVCCRKKMDSAALYCAAAVHLSNYFWSAYTKLALEGPPFAWLQNASWALVHNADLLGTQPVLVFPATVRMTAALLAQHDVLMNALTLGVEGGAALSLLMPRLGPLMLLLLNIWHVGLFATTGIFFWKWVFMNIAFLVAWPRVSRTAWSVRLLAVALLFVAGRAFSLFQAGWWDTPALNHVQVFARTQTGTEVLVPHTFYLPFSYVAATGFAYEHNDDPRLFPTSTYGSLRWSSNTMRGTYQDAASLGACLRPRQDTRQQREELPQVARIKPRFMRLTQEMHANNTLIWDHVKSWSFLWLYPHHLWSSPSAYQAFRATNPHDIVGYRFAMQTVCTDWHTGERTIQPVFSEYVLVRK